MRRRRLAIILMILLLNGMGLWAGGCTAQPQGTLNPGTPGMSPGPVQPSSQSPEPTGDQDLRIIAMGDIMLGREVAQSLEMKGLGFSEPFSHTRELLQAGDAVFCNLEHPLTESAHSLDTDNKYILKADPDAAAGLEWAGFNLISIANNHILDYYEAGLEDTLAILEDHNIAFAGAGKNLDKARRMAVIEAKGMKIGLLAYSDMVDVLHQGDPPLKFAADADKAGVAPMDEQLMMEDIRRARDQVDLLMVSIHWGVEDSFTVTRQQMELAHQLVDQGADIILGHHPHWFQGIELYQGKPIIYSLGNFIFDQSMPQSKESFILELTYSRGALSGLKAYPVGMADRTQVLHQKEEDAMKLLEREVRLCKELGTACEIVDGCLEIRLKHESGEDSY